MNQMIMFHYFPPSWEILSWIFSIKGLGGSMLKRLQELTKDGTIFN